MFLDGYLSYLRDEKRYSPLTVENYARDVRRLFECLGAVSLQEVQSPQIRRCVSQLHSQGLSGRSLARMVSAWRGFFAFLIREHGGLHNPCIGVSVPKSPKKLPEYLSPDETSRLLTFDAVSPRALCDLAMFEVLYSSGLRLAELVSLDAAQLDLSSGELRVIGKGQKMRIAPLGSHAIQAVQAWLAVRNELALPDEPALFVGQRGRRIVPRVVQLRLKARGLQQGLDKNIHPHVLRHSCASHVLQSSGDLRAVQELLGHASITSTQIYTHLDFQALSKVYDAAHPRAKKVKSEK
ncbi:MAG: tyrosine recombinase XerC [Gallionella sp.]|nr:tyrosine recombinase XerC [Gallionella sp.]